MGLQELAEDKVAKEFESKYLKVLDFKKNWENSSENVYESLNNYRLDLFELIEGFKGLRLSSNILSSFHSKYRSIEMSLDKLRKIDYSSIRIDCQDTIKKFCTGESEEEITYKIDCLAEKKYNNAVEEALSYIIGG